MTRHTKKFLFYSAMAVFLLLSYVIIMYAQGYKYSFSENKFLRTGAISLKINTDAKVFLDDEFEGETSFFGNSYSIDRLLPGKYKLSVQRDDYSGWSKTLVVEEGLVIDFPNILLLPEEGKEEQELFEEVRLLFKELEPIPTLKASPSEPFVLDTKTKKILTNDGEERKELVGDIEGFRLSENENKLAWWNKNELWVLWLTDQNYQPFHKKDDKELMIRFGQTIQNATWFRGEDHIILELERFDSKGRPYSIYQVVEIDKRSGVNIIEL